MRTSPLVSLGLALFLAPPLAAQDRAIAPAKGSAGLARFASGDGHDIPPAPGVVSAPRLPNHRFPPLPRASSPLPQPDSPPSFPGGQATQGPGAPCDIHQFLDGDATACPASCRHVVGSPSAASRWSTGFVTGNWYATRSVDFGANWTPVNPTTLFGAIDGGFCCNQRVIYEPSRDITIWYMQYDYSATTQRASVVIAVAVGNDLAAGANGVWHYWRLDPTHFGRGTGEGLDFPDIALSANHLYCTSNVWKAGVYQDSVVWKMPLDNLRAGGLLNFQYWRRVGGLGGGWAYRFTQGAEDTMRLASHNSTASMRVFRNADLPFNAPMFSVDRTVPTWSDTGYSALAPNGVNWLGNADGRITGGYVTRDEYGFLWTSAAFGAQTRPHVRVAKFRRSDDASRGTDLIWNNDLGLAYAACTTNVADQVGIVLAYGDATGSGTLHPTTAGRVRDDCDPSFAGGIYWYLGPVGASSPTVPYWGEYFSMQRHEYLGMGFVTGTMSMSNASNTDQRPRWVGYGREKATVWGGFPAVGIFSAPVSGVVINLAFPDFNGKTSVTTPGYAISDFLILTAPWSFTSAATVYAFCNWRLRQPAFGPWIDQPASQRQIGPFFSLDAQAEAVYTPAKEVTIGSRNPPAGAAITVSRTDVQSNQDGVTPFERYYKPGSADLLLTAPVSVGSQPFNRWYVDGVAQPQGLNPVTVSMAGDAPVVVEADYCTHAHGASMPFGAGCMGSTGNTPSHFTTSHGDAGTTVRFEATTAPANSSAALLLGFSNTFWNGIPLPLNLGLIGADPTCNLNVELFASLAFATDGVGNGFKDVYLRSATPLGTKLYTQTVHLDFGVPAPLKIIVSNGLELTTGGDICN